MNKKETVKPISHAFYSPAQMYLIDMNTLHDANFRSISIINLASKSLLLSQSVISDLFTCYSFGLVKIFPN